jgi:hypothetical protein
MANREFKNSNELNNLIGNNIISYIKAQRLIWFVYVHRMSNDRTVKKLDEWKPISTRLPKLNGKKL